MEVGDFVEKFHNLDGTSLGEKRKNLFILLNKVPPDHEAVISSVTPTNYLENLFRLELLLNLQRISELIQILKSEEEYLPAKLLKNKWFCKKLAAILDENGSDFVNGILPFTSFVIRRRLLTKIAIFGTKLDTVYDELCTRYGAHVARNVLVGCSATKIEDILNKQKVYLEPHQQKVLFQKYPKLFVEKCKSIDDSVVSFIANRNIETYLKITQDSYLGEKIGKRLTRKLLTKHKEYVIAKSASHGRALHSRTVVKTLREEDLKRFFFNCLPASVKNLRYGLVDLKLGRRKYKFLSEGIRKVYNGNIYDHPEVVDDDMMESMDVEEREKWISIKRKEGTPENDLIKFMKTSDSIPLIKSKINVTSSVPVREQLVEILVATCKVNDDLNALAEVCEYVSFRHRNDDESILRNFLYTLCKFFHLGKLEERHWNAVESITKILDRKGDQSFFRYDFNVQYTEFLYRQKKLDDDHIFAFLKNIKDDNRWNYKCNNKDLQKLLLLKTIELMPKLVEKDAKLHYEDVKFLNYIFEWNKEHPEEKISIFDHPRLVESYRKSAEDAIKLDAYIRELNPLNSILENFICTKEKSHFRDETIRIFFSVGFRYYNIKIDFWLLKHEPEVILAYFGKFCEHVLHEYAPPFELLKYIKKYPHFSFQEKMVDLCLEKLGKCEEVDKICVVLAVLVPAETFLQIIAPYYPVNDKFDDVENVAISIATSFKYTTSTIVLPALITYCKGDFLRYALESLYYLFYHSPENQLSQFINDLSSKAVSVRKHSIFLTCMVGSVSDVRKLLQRFMENERNVSVQKHLFTAAFKYFVKNPSDEFWDCVKVCMKNLDKNDSESFAMLVNLDRIPEEYKARYIISVWDIINKNEDLDQNHWRRRLISSIPASIYKDFSLEFLTKLISDNFLQSGSSCENAINDFVIQSLAKSNYMSEIMDTVFTIIEQNKTKKYETLEAEKNARKILFCFIYELVRSLRNDCNFFEMFSERWHALFSPAEAMREHLQLSLSLLYLRSNKDLEKFGNATAEFLDSLVSTYGVVIVDCFASELIGCLENFLCYYGEPSEEFFRFCTNILKNWNSLVFYLLVIKMLPSKQPSHTKSKELFLQIVHVLRQVPQESIQMLMNIYVLDME